MQVAKLTPYWYTPESEEDAEKPTRFKLKPLEQGVFLEIQEDCSKEENEKGEVIVKPSPSACKQILELGVVGWERFMDGKKLVKFSSSKLHLIPYYAQVELVNELFTSSSLSAAQVKN